MACSASSRVWFIDNEAANHMTRCKEFFSQPTKKDHRITIELGDDGKHSTMGMGTIKFERVKQSPLSQGCPLCTMVEETSCFGFSA